MDLPPRLRYDISWMPRKRLKSAFALAAACALLCACATSRHGEPFQHEPNFSGDVKLSLGQRVFYENCNVCHPGGNAGYGPSLFDRALPAWYVRFQVRSGLGAMPAFDDNRLPQAKLEAVTAYIERIRGTGGG